MTLSVAQKKHIPKTIEIVYSDVYEVFSIHCFIGYVQYIGCTKQSKSML
jgi:hypothetical protein